jgi:hypothetical protein
MCDLKPYTVKLETKVAHKSGEVYLEWKHTPHELCVDHVYVTCALHTPRATRRGRRLQNVDEIHLGFEILVKNKNNHRPPTALHLR